MKSEEEKKKAIEFLWNLKERRPKRSYFGDDNHLAIDMQISVIKGEITEDQIYKMESNETYDSFIIDAMLGAIDYLNGLTELEEL